MDDHMDDLGINDVYEDYDPYYDDPQEDEVDW